MDLISSALDLFSTKYDSSAPKVEAQTSEGTETNFMGMQNYKLSPLVRLRMVACSSIFGEPSYYRDSKNRPAHVKNYYGSHQDVSEYLLFKAEDTVSLFTRVIDEALDYDFHGTIKFALQLRKDFLMRLNPSVILVRAAVHPKRAEFNKEHPKVFREIVNNVIGRPDDMTNQLEYYKQLTGGKSQLPNVLKRAWAEKLEHTSRYQLKKYLNRGKLIDLVRICHAHSADIDEMMTTGDIQVADDENTWEALRSQGKSWDDILKTIRIPHMALLRNVRGIAKEMSETNDATGKMEWVMGSLKEGVEKGKQFPFRYYSAYKAVSAENGMNNDVKQVILKGLENCMEIAMANFPTLKGKTISLCDNSGSAWGTFNSQYGTVTVANIANLSGIMTAMNSDEGEVGIFGDRLKVVKIPKNTKMLNKLHDLSENVGKQIGGATENGIWLFFDDAIRNRKHYDNIFIYSDMQAGHGGLYGCNANEYKNYQVNGRYINVMKLIETYRREVNPRANVFSVQVAGYDNSVVPEMMYRGSILAGWTGNEVLFAKEFTDLWNEIESNAE